MFAALNPAPVKRLSVVITRSVGEVGPHVVTSREVRISEAIEQVLAAKAATAGGFRVLTGEEKSFPVEVGRVLDEWMVYLEAKSLASGSIGQSESGAWMKQISDRLGNQNSWRTLEVSSDELREMVARKKIAKDFERLKSDPQLAPVSDDDALSYYRKNRLRFGSLPFSTFKENIKTLLIQQQTEKRLAEWRDVLRRKYRVRNFIAG